MVKRLDRYCLRDLLVPFLLTLLLFPVMMLLDTVFSLQDLFVQKRPPLGMFLRIILLKLPAIYVLAFPVATLFGIVMSVNRLARDHELLSIRMAGISFYRILIPLAFAAVVFSAAAFGLNEYIVPKTNHESENLVRRLVLTQPLPLIQENLVFKGGPNQFFFIRRYDPERRLLHGVAVYEQIGDRFPRAITAQTAQWTTQYWELKEGVIHYFGDEGFLEWEAKFDRMRIRVDFDIVEFLAEQKTPQEMTSGELRKKLDVFKRGGVDVRSLETDYHFKFSIPFACLIVTILGAPLSVFFARSGSFVGLGLCLVLVLFYYSLMAGSRSMGFNGVIPPIMAAWLPNLVFGLVGSALVYKVEH